MKYLTPFDKRNMIIAVFVVIVSLAVLLGAVSIFVFVGGCRDCEGIQRPLSPVDSYFNCVSRCTQGWRNHYGEDEVRRCLAICERMTLPSVDAFTETMED